MEEKTFLTMGVDSFTLLDLLRRAAIYKGLKLLENASRACSEPIKEYALDDNLLAVLAKHGIKQQARPDCNHEIFTLVDHNPQETITGWVPSNYWNFKLLNDDKRKFDLRVTLSVDFMLSLGKRGIMFLPQARGSFVSAGDLKPNFRIFKALVECDNNAPAIARELAASDGIFLVTWTEFGLSGIRRLSDLFAEFVNQNETIMRLGRKGEVFNPAPYPHWQSGEELFITEPAQPKIVQAWRMQLNEYRACLVV
jgi:hypothetical protein